MARDMETVRDLVDTLKESKDCLMQFVYLDENVPMIRRIRRVVAQGERTLKLMEAIDSKRKKAV